MELRLVTRLSELERLEVSGGRSFVLRTHWIRYFLCSVERVFTVRHAIFTLHDHQHSDMIVEHLFDICSNANLLDETNAYALNYPEVFYLIAGSYLHDIGMIIENDDDSALASEEGISIGDVIRRDHHVRSAEFVRSHGREMFIFDNLDLEIVSALCRGHRLNSLDGQEFDDRYDYRNRRIRVRLLAGLLQVADELDMSHHRAPPQEYIFMSSLLNPVAFFHWRKHYYTESVHFTTEIDRQSFIRTVKTTITLAVPDAQHRDFMEREIRQRFDLHLNPLNPIFKENGFELKLGEFTGRISTTIEQSVLSKGQSRILYVDDDPTVQRLVVEALRKRGFYHCSSASNPGEALSQVFASRHEPFHFVILDMEMHDLAGKYSKRAGLDLVIPIRNGSPESIIVLFADLESTDLKAEASRLNASVISKTQGVSKLADMLENLIKLRFILEESPQPLEESAMNTVQRKPEKYRILVVDDKPDNVQVLMDKLREEGFDVDYADGADTAAEVLGKKPFHGAVLDKQMNNLRGDFDDDAGIELAKYMLEKHGDVCCLILTYTASAKSIKETMDMDNMFDFLDKQFNGPAKVVARIRQMMDTRADFVRACTGMVEQTDRMAFYGKIGVVTKIVTNRTDEEAGCVEIDGQRWTATTRDTKGIQTTSRIVEGRRVRAYGIRNGAIQVVNLDV